MNVEQFSLLAGVVLTLSSCLVSLGIVLAKVKAIDRITMMLDNLILDMRKQDVLLARIAERLDMHEQR